MEDALGNVIDFVEYDDTSPWDSIADGDGPSLELLNPLFDNILAENWGASTGYGTPGTYNSVLDTNNNFIKPLPHNFVLHNNYPNPFNPITTIKFELPKSTNVKLAIYNIIGNLVKMLYNDKQLESGYYSINWDGKDENGKVVSSGVYFYKMETEDFIETKKMILLK